LKNKLNELLTLEIYAMQEFCEDENVQRKDLEPLITNADAHMKTLIELAKQFIKEFLGKIDRIFVSSEETNLDSIKTYESRFAEAIFINIGKRQHLRAQSSFSRKNT
jgi:hypothetical protein